MKYLTIRSYLVGALVIAASSSAALALDINTASTAELTQAGFSKTQAERIVAYHKAHGDFHSAADVLKVQGVTKATLQKVSAKLNSGAGAAARADTAATVGAAQSKAAQAGVAGSATTTESAYEGSSGSSTANSTSAGAGLGASVGIGANAGASGTGVGVGTKGGVSVGIGK